MQRRICAISDHINIDQSERNEIVTKHIHLVGYVLKNIRFNNIDREDAYQIGCMGLIKAAERYEGNHGVMFSTFATHHIRNAIMKELGKINRFYRDNDIKEPKEISDMKLDKELDHGVLEQLEIITEATLDEQAREKGFTTFEIELVKMRCGVGHYPKPLSTTAISSMLGMSRMNISLILRKTFKKLRKQGKINELYSGNV